MTTQTQSWLPKYAGRPISRRRLLGGAAAGVGGAALLAACGGSSGGTQLIKSDDARKPGGVWEAANSWKLEDETKQAVPGGTFLGHATSDLPQNFDIVTLASSQVDFAAHNHEFLMVGAARPGLDPASVEATYASPSLAEAWEFSADGSTVTFTMRQGVKFHNVAPVNGRVMDIDDWRTTDERYMQESQYRVGMGAARAKVTFPDARHMVWQLNAPLAGIQEMIYGEKWTYMVAPKEQHRDRALAETKSIGTGFKVLESYQPSIGFEYKKHPEYWGGEPFIDRWRAPIIPEYANRYAQFQTGKITNFTPAAGDVVNLSKDAPGTVIVLEEMLKNHLDCHFFGLTNAKTAPWADPRVRIAIRQSIDWKGIAEVESARQQLAAAGIDIELRPTTHVTNMPGVWLNPEKGELGDLSKNFLYDPAEARKNLQAAGFPNPVALPFSVTPANTTNELVIDSLKRTGTFNVNVVTYVNDIAYRDCGRFLNCEGTMGTISHDDEIDRVIFRQFHSLGNIARGPQPYANPALDAMIIAQQTELDVEKRRGILKDLQLQLAREMPAFPSRHHFNVVAFRWPWVHNLGWGETKGIMPGAWNTFGGHKQWLDKDMPNRNG